MNFCTNMINVSFERIKYHFIPEKHKKKRRKRRIYKRKKRKHRKKDIDSIEKHKPIKVKKHLIVKKSYAKSNPLKHRKNIKSKKKAIIQNSIKMDLFETSV